MNDIKLGALCWDQYADWPDPVGEGTRADRLGYDTLWTWASDRCIDRMGEIKIGALCWNKYTDWPSLLQAGIRADQLGYISLWTWDHLSSSVR